MSFVDKVVMGLALCLVTAHFSTLAAAPTTRRAKAAPSVTFLLKQLKQQKWRARYDAAMALGKRGGKLGWKVFGTQAKVVEKALLKLLLQDKNFWVRAGVAKALGQLGDRAVLPLVQAMLRDRQSEVRNAAAKALGVMARSGKTPVVGGHFGKVVAALNKALKDKAIRWTAAHTLELLTGNPQPLVAVMMADLKRRNPTIQGMVAMAFGKLSMRAKAHATHVLIKALGTEPAAAHPLLVRALVSIGKSALPALQQAQKHKQKAVRAGATAALQKIGKP